jgi:hypothetical protein
MRAQLRRRGVVLAAVGLLVTLVASGCAQNPALRPAAAAQETVDCRSEVSSLPPNAEGQADDAKIPVPGRVPDGFEAVAALRCSLDLTLAPVPDLVPPPLEFWPEGNSTPELQKPENPADVNIVWKVERFEGDLTGLLDALAAPDDAPPADRACTADMEIVQALWLEDRSGEVVPVHYPRNGCGKTKPAVRDALSILTVTNVERVQLDSDE